MVRYVKATNARPVSSMTIALGNKTAAPSSEDDLVYMVALVGHSGQSGGKPFRDLADPSFPTDREVPRVFIWDKTRRSNSDDATLTDASRGGEAHTLRAITVGYAGTSPLYPWEQPTADLHFGPEASMAQDWYTHRKGTLVIVKHAVSGSRASDVVGARDWNLNDDSGESHTEVFLTAYWEPALAAAVALAGGDRSKVRILGISWFQGFSDARTVSEATAHSGFVVDILEEMRSNIQASSPAAVPILAVNGPLTKNSQGDVVGELEILRDGVAGLETGSGETQEMINCTVLDTDGYPDDPLDLPHFTAEGNEMLGLAYGRFFRTVTGATLTP